MRSSSLAAVAAAALAGIGLFASGLASAAVIPVDVTPYSAPARFGDVTISPDGRHLAVTVVHEDRTGVAILERETQEIVVQRAMGRDTHVTGIAWVSDERILFSLAQKFGTVDQPSPTGELFTMTIDSPRDRLLVGARFQGSGGLVGASKEDQSVAAYLVDDLPENDDEVLVTIVPYSRDPVTTVERMNVRTGRRVVVGRAPVARAMFVTDHAHRVRFARGSDADNHSRLYHRADDDAEWVLVNDEAKTGVVESAIGFSPGDRIAWLQVERERGPDAIVAYDTVSGDRKQVLAHDTVDPGVILYSGGADPAPVGVQYSGARFDYGFFDPGSVDAERYRMLLAAFPGQAPFITSTTADGRLAVVQVVGLRQPGEFYLFDTTTKAASFLLRRREGVPADAGDVRGITVTARDGMKLHGYLTTPAGSGGRDLPLVVYPHGGPFGVHDALGYDPHVQLMAKAGYAVLQINHRGSSGYGRAYHQAGAREWGRKLQDDLTDATRWAIDQGVADADRICIYGASYGAYAALHGVATQPRLYRCAVGYVGVYDLAMMVRPESRQSHGRQRWMDEWIGSAADVAPYSVTTMADRIEVPVFLAAGGADRIAPIEHSEKMETALREAGVPVETLYHDSEGHGFYTVAHRREFDTRLLAFLAKHIGGAPPAQPGETP